MSRSACVRIPYQRPPPATHSLKHHLQRSVAAFENPFIPLAEVHFGLSELQIIPQIMDFAHHVVKFGTSDTELFTALNERLSLTFAGEQSQSQTPNRGENCSPDIFELSNLLFTMLPLLRLDSHLGCSCSQGSSDLEA